MQLTNDQNIRLSYRRNEIRIEQARLHGPDTDLQLGGSARFDRDRQINFSLSGGVNLRLLKSVLPDLEARGRADANVSIEGTIDRPRVTGRASVRGASAAYADFPVGLSNVNGEFVFDRSRLLFDKVTADSGGGHLTLNGSVTYGEGPMRYDVTAATSTVRIRYPVGMSWLAGGTLQLSGTSDAALVSGHVQVERLLFAEGVDVASFFASASDTSPSPGSSSPFLQNLSFDVQGQTNPGARIEWAGAHVEVDGDVRLRGTWDHPVLLGHIHLLGGEMPFRGNNFELTRGDINFSNPFRLDPVLNVEATSTINQYQVTIDFSGPASHLALNYRSDPPLPDSDIVALLALGSPGEGSALRSGPGASQNYGATALLSEAISSGIGGRIEHLVRHQFLPRGSVRRGNGHGIERRRTRHDPGAGHARSDDHLFHQRRHLEPVSADPGGIHREARPLRRLPARYQRHLRPRRQIRQTFQVTPRARVGCLTSADLGPILPVD